MRGRLQSRNGALGSAQGPSMKQRVTLRMLDALPQQSRVADGRDGEPSAEIIDSQSVSVLS
jgi:hypothetical protein